MKNPLAWTILAWAISSGSSEMFLDVLEFPGPSLESAQINNLTETKLDSGFGLCLRARYTGFSMQPVVLINDLVKLKMYDNRQKRGQLVLGNRTYHYNLSYDDFIKLPLTWLAICVNFDQVKRSLSLAVNQKILFNETVNWSDESLSLGQVVTIGAGFMGKLTDLNMWSKPLTPTEVEQYQDCDTSVGAESILIDWPNANITRDSDVIRVKSIPVEEVCRDEPKLKIFPHKMPFMNASKLCQDLDGKMFLPESKSATIDQQSLPTSCGGELWIPVKRLENNSLVSMSSINDGNKVSKIIDLGSVENPESPDHCVVASGSGNRAESCEAEHCFVCEIVRCPVFKFRGKHVGLFDYGYMLDLDEDLYNFKSFSGAKGLIGNIEGKSWELQDQSNPSVITATLPMTFSIPIGTNNWTISSLPPQSGQSLLKMTKCKTDEFTCNDGTCISLIERCDIYPDCKDSSDELNCNFLQYTYYEDIDEPPLQRKGDNRVPVNVSIQIDEFEDFDELRSTYKVKFLLNLTWYDYRLTFENLKSISEGFNYLTKKHIDTIWKPPLSFRNSFERIELAFDNITSVFVPRRGEPFPDNLTNYCENEMFSGANNPLVYLSNYELLLNCKYDLKNYPFDHQTCSIDLVAPFYMEGLINFVPINLTYSGPTQLLQYQVLSYKMDTLPDNARIHVSVNFQRISTFHLTNTYLPSACLLLIGLMTLFFGLEDLQLLIGLALSLLVVVYTMYQTVQDSLPKTAFLKSIDICLLFCLIFHFLILLIHMLTKMFNAIKLLHVTRVVLPASTIAFLAFYIRDAISASSDP